MSVINLVRQTSFDDHRIATNTLASNTGDLAVLTKGVSDAADTYDLTTIVGALNSVIANKVKRSGDTITGALSINGATTVNNNLTINTGNVAITGTGTLSVNGNVSLVGTSNAVGTITSGTWQGSTVGVGYGGTGINSIASSNNYIMAVATDSSSYKLKNLTSSDSSVIITQTNTAIDLKVSASSFTGSSITISSGNSLLGTLTPTTAINQVTEVGVHTDLVTFQLTTTSTSAGQVIAYIPIATYNSADFHISSVISGGLRQTTKIAAAYNGTTSVDYTEYASIPGSNNVGSFSVSYDSGSSSLVLTVTPSSATSTTFKVFAILIKG